MGMTNDYLDALEYNSTYLRIGTGIFGRELSNFYFCFLLINLFKIKKIFFLIATHPLVAE